jgi:hypothetical protein
MKTVRYGEASRRIFSNLPLRTLKKWEIDACHTKPLIRASGLVELEHVEFKDKMRVFIGFDVET